jgi:hypothetical protein
MPTKRAIFSVAEGVLDDFNRSVPLVERSKVIEGFMRSHVTDIDARLEAAAKAIENDPAYADVLTDSALLTAETASRLPPHG